MVFVYFSIKFSLSNFVLSTHIYVNSSLLRIFYFHSTPFHVLTDITHPVGASVSRPSEPLRREVTNDVASKNVLRAINNLSSPHFYFLATRKSIFVFKMFQVMALE